MSTLIPLTLMKNITPSTPMREVDVSIKKQELL